jgi:hypothetical protein
VGHLRRSDVDGISAIARITTDLLHEDNGRNGPGTPFSAMERRISFAPISTEGKQSHQVGDVPTLTFSNSTASR